MSFRTRLTLFFAVIVVVPMVAMAFVVFGLLERSAGQRTDAQLAEAERAATAVYRASRRQASTVADRVGRDARLAAAIRAGDAAALQERLRTLLDDTGARAIRVALTGRPPVTAGAPDVVAPAFRALDDGSRRVGTLAVATVTAREYAAIAFDYTRLGVVVSGPGGRVRASTVAGVRRAPPARGEVTVAGEELRVRTFTAASLEGGPLRVHLLADPAAADDGTRLGEGTVAGVLLVFLLLAFGFAMTVSRSLQSEIRRLLGAARRVAGGDFTTTVPADGRDEFAQLGQEFNAMAGQLQARVGELQRERLRLHHAIRRLGASFAKGLDRQAVLGIVVESAMDAVGATAGRASMLRDGSGLRPAATAGPTAGHEAALQAAEAAAMERLELESVSVDGIAAMAHPMRVTDRERVVGVLAVARQGAPYSAAERDVLAYLARQAAQSVENVDLHEAMRRQAVTDELTGIANHRRFQEALGAEVERVRRFGQPVALVMLDIDDFKLVNDTFGHVQGDRVLREVAGVLRALSREIDLPARYGGEEMAVVLPQTGADGAYQFAERVREAIERVQVPVTDEPGRVVRVTASLGVATAPASAPADKDALVAAADAALYRAKAQGKNRTVRAEAVAA